MLRYHSNEAITESEHVIRWKMFAFIMNRCSHTYIPQQTGKFILALLPLISLSTQGWILFGKAKPRGELSISEKQTGLQEELGSVFRSDT